jgi:hypothetical protein
VKTLAFDSLPPFDESLTRDEILGDLEVVTAGDHCLVRKTSFLALCSLKTGEVNWCVTRNAPDGYRDPSKTVFSNSLFCTKLWIGLNDQVVAEVFYDNPESARLVARCMRTSKILWEYVHRRPPLASWAEEKPAWPGAPQEEIYVFLTRSENNLVLCLHRRTRRSRMWTPELKVWESPPPFQCQTDLFSFEPTSGAIRWSKVQIGLRLDLLEWNNFKGVWVNDRQAGWLDLDSGVVCTIEKGGCCFGMPTVYGKFGYFPWFDKKSKSIGYFRANQRMEVDCDYSWNEKGVRDIKAWPSSSGVALQVNDQKVIWTNTGERVWEQRAKPYVYNVFATDDSDIFVATDGAGGRLLGFDRADGHETLNFKPVFCGLGHSHFFEEAQIAVASVAMKKSHWVPSKLLIFNTETKSMDFVSSCWNILAPWSRGVVFVSGEKDRRIAFLDLNS